MCLSSYPLLAATILVVTTLVAAGPLPAATYPAHPIHLLVPYPPGGPNDVIARLIAEKLDETFGQQIIVENRAGGNGNIAVIEVARAAPDGYTLVLPGMPYAVNPSLYLNVGYSFDQFTPVSIVTKGPLVLVVHPSLGVKSVQQLVALAKERPGKTNYASGANGTSLHLAAELFKQAANVDLQQITYNGTNALIPDLLTGRVPVAFISPLVAKQYVTRGDLLALGVTSAKRSPAWPDTPTIAEAGLPGFSMEAWYTILAPRATPARCCRKAEHGYRWGCKITRRERQTSISGQFAGRQHRGRGCDLYQYRSQAVASDSCCCSHNSSVKRTRVELWASLRCSRF